MSKEIDMNKAEEALLEPFHKEFNEGETLEVFIQKFFEQGGQVNVRLPLFIQEKMGIEPPPAPEPEIFGPGAIDPEEFTLPGEMSYEELSIEDRDEDSGTKR